MTGSNSHASLQGMIKTAELQNRWNLSSNIVYSIVRKFDRNIMHKGILYINLEEIESYETHSLSKKKPKLNGEYMHSSEIKDWLTENEFSDPNETFKRMIRDKLFVNQIRQGKSYIIPNSEFEQFTEQYETYRLLSMSNEPSNQMGFRPKGTLSIRELSVRWNLSSYKSVYKYFENNKLPQPIVFLGTQFVHLKDIEVFESKKEIDNLPITIEKLILKMQEQILKYNHDCSIQIKKFYVDFCLLKLKSSTASMRKKSENVTAYINTYKRYVSKFIYDPSTLSHSEIEMLMLRKDIPSYKKETILEFIRYCDSLLNIKRSKKIVLVRDEKKRSNSDDNSIYSPELYFQYVNYVKNLNPLVQLSISSQKASNAWLFIIMHLTDVWRAPDIVNNIPTINIEEIGIDSLNWFNENQISIKQASTVVQQVSKNVENAISSKTKALLNFFVIPDMVVPFATAAVISELHRRNQKQELLLGTLISHRISVSTKQLMFKDNEQLMGFQTRKMNRSTLTYLFYSIIEENGPDADVALELAKISRSHKSVSSTEIYLNNTNKDGSINKVSLNVFRRGHFGWLYNYIIKMAINPLAPNITSPNKTEMIELLRADIKPYEVEAWGSFINEKVNQEQSVILGLTRRNTEDFILLLKRFMSGKMPSRTAGGQCLIYPDCEYPLKKHCFDCKYFLPHSSVLIESTIELKRLCKSLKESKYDALLQRDSRFLLYIILLFHEAFQSFDEEYVNSFLPKHEFQTIIEEVMPLLKLQSATIKEMG